LRLNKTRPRENTFERQGGGEENRTAPDMGKTISQRLKKGKEGEGVRAREKNIRQNPAGTNGKRSEREGTTVTSLKEKDEEAVSR